MVFSTEFDDRFHAKNVLVDSEEDSWDAQGNYNYWLAGEYEKDGQGFTMKVDNCPRKIAGCYIRNTGRGAAGSSTKDFTVSGSLNKDGPWVILAEDRLAYYTGSKPATLRELKFDDAVEVQFLKFDLVSYWGRGGGLQYFAAILTTGKYQIMKYRRI